MNKFSPKEIAEVIGLLAILAGLYFVYTEIQQTSIIARAEMSAVAQMRMEYISAQFSEPEFRATYVKGLRSPEDLTESERLRLHAFFEDVVGILFYESHNYNLGIFEEYEVLTSLIARRYFMRGFGRAWWRIEKATVPDAIVRLVDREIADPDRSIDWIWLDDQLRSEIDAR